MAKQLMSSERPGESQFRQSIGNYKGVMLCNRPNDPKTRPNNDGPSPFVSRVTPKEQIGLNPTAKLPAHAGKKGKCLEVLKKHKQWLKQLQQKKEEEEKVALEQTLAEEERKLKIKQKAEKRRKYLEAAPESQVEETYEPEPKPEVSVRTAKLTEKNLKTHEKRSREEKKRKPKWAMTEEQVGVEEDKEVDELLNFVADLDYDNFINDLDVRQALEIVKERVEEIKKDKEWKQNIADKYNGEAEKKDINRAELKSQEAKSATSSVSMKSFVSKARSQVEKNNLDQDKASEAGWDRSTKPDNVSVGAEDKVARLVADQVLANFPKLKGIHSNASIRVLLEKEARKYIDAPQPVISTIKEENRKIDVSNLPYLHRNPAV